MTCSSEAAARLHPARCVARLAAAVCGFSLLMVAFAAEGAEATSGPFTVSVDLRKSAADLGCSILTTRNNVSVSCGATALQPFAPATVLPATPGAAAYVRPAVGGFRGGEAFPSIAPDVGDLRTRTGRELEGVNFKREDEDDSNVFVSLLVEPDDLWRMPVDFGQYSSRTIVVGGRKYVEMTVSW